MIFSRLFTPDYAKPDPKIRQAAIARLSPDEPKSKQILHELAFNDDSAEVNLAALHKLNSFALWQKTAQTAKNQRVKKSAVQFVTEAVLSEERLPLNEKKQFLLESANSDLALAVIDQCGTIFDDCDFALALLERVNRQSANDKLFLHSANPTLQLAMLEKELNVNVLQKWLKKSTDKDVITQIETRLLRIQEAAQKPIELSKEVTLVLSKLLALVDQSDFNKALTSRKQLESEYNELKKQFDVLDVRDIDLYLQKKSAIDTKLDKHFAVIESDYQQARVEQIRSDKIQLLTSQTEELKHTVSALFDNIQNATLHELEATQNKIQQVLEQLELQSQELGQKYCEPLAQTLNSLGLKLTRIPEWQRHTEVMSSILAELQSAANELMDTPEKISEQLSQLQTRFFEEYDADSPLAEAHLQYWRELKHSLNKMRKDYQGEIDKIAAAFRKQLNIISSLIQQGKYKAAIKKFSDVQSDWLQASDAVKRMVKRKYDDILIEIEHLEGWQNYLAAPRKPQLLEEARELVNDMALSMKERADKIKLMRKQWQSLSVKTEETEEDKALSTQFDNALEQAFKPCREYFAEKEKQRKEAAEARRILIGELQDLVADASVEGAELLKRFDSLQKKWREQASLPKAEYETLKRSYDKTRLRVNEKLAPYLENNYAAKALLIKKTEQLLNGEVIENITDEAKKLQQRWKETGSAGIKQDNKLYRNFRDLQNKIFEQAKQDSLKKKTEIDSEIRAFEAEFEAFSKKQQNLNDADFKEGIASLEKLIAALPKRVQSGFYRTVSDLEEKRKVYLKEQERAKKVTEAKALHNLLNALNGKTITQTSGSNIDSILEELASLEDWSLLPKTWQNALFSNKKADLNSVVEQLITLEILLSIESPPTQQELRRSLQINLLSESFKEQPLNKINDAIIALLAGLHPDVLTKELVERVGQAVVTGHSLS